VPCRHSWRYSDKRFGWLTQSKQSKKYAWPRSLRQLRRPLKPARLSRRLSVRKLIVHLRVRGARGDRASKASAGKAAARREIARREIAPKEIAGRGVVARMEAVKVAEASGANAVTTVVAAIAAALKDRLKSISRN
jgi:hypothetical protein